MIDPTKPMYDADGRKWVALRLPDGSVYKYSTSYLVTSGGSYLVMNGHGEVLGVGYKLTNTPPQKDWNHEVFAYGPEYASSMKADQSLKIRAGYRNGQPFAEVVQP